MNQINLDRSDQKRSRLPKAYIACGVICLIFGAFIMNQIDQFVNGHTFDFQSPIVLQTPVVIQDKLVSPLMITKVVEATKEATVSASPKK